MKSVRAWALCNPDGTIATGPSYDRNADVLQIFPTVGTAQDAHVIRGILAATYIRPRAPYRESVRACTITFD
jgi:hypothetical protein